MSCFCGTKNQKQKQPVSQLEKDPEIKEIKIEQEVVHVQSPNNHNYIRDQSKSEQKQTKVKLINNNWFYDQIPLQQQELLEEQEIIILHFNQAQKDKIEIKKINLQDDQYTHIKGPKEKIGSGISVSICPQANDYVITQLQSFCGVLPNLKHLYLEFDPAYRISEKLILQLKDLISSSVNLTSFSFYAEDNSYLQYTFEHNLFESLSNYSKLTYFKVNIANTNANDDVVEQIFQGILNNTQLSVLQIFLDKNPLIGDKSFVSLFTKDLPKFDVLNQLILWLSKTNITDETIAQFSTCIKLISSIKNLSISLDGCQQITPQVGELFRQAFLYQYIHLQKLELWFSNTKINDKAIELISQSIKMQAELQSITVALDWSNCLDLSVYYIGESIQYLYDINQVEFYLSWLNGKDHGITKLFQVIGNLEKLNKLSIDISNNDIEFTDRSGQMIAQTLLKLKKLETLKLDLGGNKTISDDSCKEIANSLSSLQKLKSVSVYMDEMKSRISNETGIALCESLQNLKLERLDIVLSNTGIDEETIESLSNVLQNQQQLQYLNLNLRKIKATKESFIILIQSLRNINNLKSLNLCFANNNYIDNDIGNHLIQAISNYGSSLTQLRLDFNITQVDDEFGVQLGEKIKYFEQLADITIELKKSNVTDISAIYLQQSVTKIRQANENIVDSKIYF